MIQFSAYTPQGYLFPAPLPDSPPHPRDSERVRPPLHLDESSLAHQLHHRWRRWKPLHRTWQIPVRHRIARNPRANRRQHMPKIKPKYLPHHPARLAAIQNPHFAARFQHPQKLLQPSPIIRQVAKPKRRGDQVQRPIRERHPHRIHRLDRNPHPLELHPRQRQHLLRKIRRNHRLSVRRPPPQQRSGHVAGAAANVQHLRLRPRQNIPEAPRRPPPPRPVHIAREHMVQQVIARSNAVEHLPHQLRRRRLIHRPSRPRPWLVFQIVTSVPQTPA